MTFAFIRGAKVGFAQLPLSIGNQNNYQRKYTHTRERQGSHADILYHMLYHSKGAFPITSSLSYSNIFTLKRIRGKAVELWLRF